MGYYANGGGAIDFDGALTKDQYEEVRDILTNVFNVDGMQIYTVDEKTFTSVSVWDDEKYWEDSVFETLNQIAEKFPISSACIEYHGDDDEHWRLIWKNGEWTKIFGTVVYEGDPAPKGTVVYLYKASNDDPSFGKNVVRVFPTEDDAKGCLNQQVAEAYGAPLEELRKCTEYGDDVLEDTNVIIDNDGGDVSYYSVEEHVVEEFEREQ